MSTPTKAKKPAKAKTVKAKTVKAEPAISDATHISFKTLRPNGKTGPKTTLLALVPKKGGITMKALMPMAEAEGLKGPRVVQFIKRLARDGHVELG